MGERMVNVPRALFIWDDRDLQGVGLENPPGGNVGVGGTDFLFASIPHELGQRGLSQVAVLHQDASNRLSPCVESIVVPEGQTFADTLRDVAHRFDVIVGRPSELLQQCTQALPGNARVVAWAHNHLRGPMLSWLGSDPRIVAVVNVGREQMLLTRLSAAYPKSTWIDNPVYDTPSVALDAPRRCRAVYMGALVASKGFHALAKVWPRIKAAVPEAELDVIGSADLYGGDPAAGQAYVDQLHRHLGGDAAKMGVRFHGKLGIEKNDVLRQALVGLPNPTGFTETSCLSALEMSSAGLAIVAPQRWGFCDTVSPEHSGVLAPHTEAYVNAVIDLLSHPAKARELGASGREWVAQRFSYAEMAVQWQTLFVQLLGAGLLKRACPEHPTGVYPHGWLYRCDFLGTRAQAVLDVADKAVGWQMRR